MDGEYVFFLDYVEKFRLKTNQDRLAGIGFQVSHDVASFDQIKLRKKQYPFGVSQVKKPVQKVVRRCPLVAPAAS